MAQAPGNDQCSTATAISNIPFNLNSIDTSMATSDGSDPTCNVAATDVGVWFSFLGNDKILEIKVLNPTFNAKIAIFSGSCNTLVCVDDSANVDTFSWAATLNTQYYILISGASQSKGTFNLAISVRPATCKNKPFET